MAIMRATIYASASSEMPSAASIRYQVRPCRTLCADRGYQVVEFALTRQ